MTRLKTFFPAFAAMSLLVAGCGQSGGSAGDSADGPGSMMAQLRATCVSRVENNAVMAGAASQICDCATRRARENPSVSDLMAGEASGLQDIVAQCADEALGLGTTETISSRTET